MKLFNIFRKRATDTEPITPDVSDVLLKALLRNETITREMALTIPAISSAVDLIGNTIACMPVKLYKYKSGKVEEIENDNRTKLLNQDTGDTLDPFQLKKAMVEDYLLGKGGYCYIQKDRNDATGLYYVKDIRLTTLPNFEPIFKDFVIEVEGKTYAPYEFIKILRNTKDGANGKGLIDEVSKAIETAYQTLLYQLGMAKTGGNKKGFIKSTNKLTEESITALKTAWANMYQNNTENVVVLNQGLDFQESSSTSVEMQLNQNKKTLTDEINAIFHIHPDNFELTFKQAIYPIIKAFETALNRDLLLEKEKKNMFFEFDVKEILRASIKERYEAYDMALKSGFKTINEIRRMENDNYIEGMDVLNLGLGSVLYDVKTGTFYTPNTDTKASMNDNIEPIDENIDITPEFAIDENATKDLENVMRRR